MNYRLYIASASWRDSPARRAELRLAGHRCRLCYRPRRLVRLEVHHRTYARLGRERVSDLLCVCVDCHREITSRLRRLRYAARTPRASDVRRALAPLPAMPDPMDRRDGR